MASVGVRPSFRRTPSAFCFVFGSMRAWTIAVFMTLLCHNRNTDARFSLISFFSFSSNAWVTGRPALWPIRSSLLVSVYPFVASLPADIELMTQLIEPKIAFQVLCNETHSLVHDGNAFPTHRHLLDAYESYKKCYPSTQNNLLPISPFAHRSLCLSSMVMRYASTHGYWILRTHHKEDKSRTSKIAAMIPPPKNAACRMCPLSTP
jgi:hypothetical protein